jgi:hypothetical protein
MKKILIILTSCLAIIGVTGCSMCCGPFDYDYPTFGGKHTRANRNYGRVGSLLSDPLAINSGPGADSNLSAPEEPRAIDLDEDFDSDSFDDEYDSDRTDDDLESIEPLRDEDSGDSNGATASNRWRPRPLRGRKQFR